MESKKEIYDLIPAGFYPPTLFFKTGTSNKKVLATVNEKQLQFPLVGKPDIGMQGKAVKKILNYADLIDYASKSKVDFLIQEFVPYEK
jgi:glutathione synthase/RimK-type ligase-like ATP-grasp enzyme